jgi:hypothetical protein
VALCHVTAELLVQVKFSVANLTHNLGFWHLAIRLAFACNRKFLLKGPAGGGLRILNH